MPPQIQVGDEVRFRERLQLPEDAKPDDVYVVSNVVEDSDGDEPEADLTLGDASINGRFKLADLVSG